LQGKGEVGTLISARLDKHYGEIIQNIDRVQLGYDLIKILNKATEDHPEAEYFHLLQSSFAALDDHTISPELIRIWFEIQLLAMSGHGLNLITDSEGNKLTEKAVYNFDYDSVSFAPHPSGRFTADHIKTLRLIYAGNKPSNLVQVNGLNELLPDIAPLVRTMLTSYIRI
jgi:recombinational DNA repair protein (RecF pathway)